MFSCMGLSFEERFGNVAAPHVVVNTSFAFPSLFPSGGAPTGASLHLDRLPLQRRRPRRRALRLRRLRPALPASSPMCAEDCDDGGPGSGSALPPGPGRRHVGPDHRLMW